ncbi:hypothetical protein CLOSTASPAR_01519 [[Clostridium] asparagiforme DSM 15981]|uniref:Uncharacterized protein n=1 Tax=[Clostridium] asparagiforme DSM 15981 TaxID=518636 RepID=C0CWZ9_9FIRM|nr:hypothetical protein CLOSTASPAR_01519 [[Clostridium] asparagiforme DSM 15981]
MFAFHMDDHRGGFSLSILGVGPDYAPDMICRKREYWKESVQRRKRHVQQILY